MSLNATQRALARTTLAGIIGAYFSAMIRGEGALATGILELFQSRYTKWFPAIDAVYSSSAGGGRPPIVPTRLAVNGALNSRTRVAIAATLDTWLFTINDSTAHSAQAARIQALTNTNDVMSWWTDFTSRYIPLDSRDPNIQAFWTFDSIVTREPGTVDAKVGALAIAAERAVTQQEPGAVELPGSIVTGKRRSADSNLGVYLAVGTFAALFVGTGVLVYKRRRR